MNKIIKRITTNRLKDFSGLSIEGELPVSEALVNDAIQLFMGKKINSSSDNNASNSSTEEIQMDISEMISMLDVKDLKVELKEKKAVLKLDMRKY